MITNTTIQCGEETLTNEDESPEGINYLKSQIAKLSVKNEGYKQELHELHRKLEISRTMETELTELHRNLEQTLEQQKAQTSRRIREIEERYVEREKILQDKIADMEAEIIRAIEENASLRETVKINAEKLSSLDRTQPSMNLDDNTDLLKAQIEELTELLTQEEEARRRRDECIQAMERELAEMKEIHAAMKKQLAEKNEATESMRQELFECRMELESLKAAPAEEKSKGNSLFAEVEDRRKMTLAQMNAMRSSYLEAKRAFQAKEAEIKALKTERSLLLRKWEDDTVEKIQQDASLVEKYRERIGELEARLKEEQKKNKLSTKSQQPSENNFTFLQSLVNSKSKQIEELTAKIENESIKALFDEESKHKMGKQLRYWRYRAMSGEAQLLMIKDRLESDPSAANAEILEAIKKRLSERNIDPNETFKNESTLREPSFIDETTVTLDSLMAVPNPKPKQPPSPENLDKIFGRTEYLEKAHDSASSMEETAVINTHIPSHKSSKTETMERDILNVFPMEETAVIPSRIRSYKIDKEEPKEHGIRSVLPMEETAVIHSHITTMGKPIKEETERPDTRNVLPMEETAVISSLISSYKPNKEEWKQDDIQNVLPMEETAVISSHIRTHRPGKGESEQQDFRRVLPMEETAVISSVIKTYEPSEEQSQQADIWRVLPMEETEVISSHIRSYVSNVGEWAEPDFHRMDDFMEIERDTNEPSTKALPLENDENHKGRSSINCPIARPALKSVLSRNNENGNFILASNDRSEKEKKTLRFAADTLDPPNKALKKLPTTAPKYPLVFISSNKSKK